MVMTIEELCKISCKHGVQSDAVVAFEDESGRIYLGTKGESSGHHVIAIIGERIKIKDPATSKQ